MIETLRRPLAIGMTAVATAFTLFAFSEAPRAQAPSAGAGGGWTSLFDGKTLTGWRGYRQPDATATRWVVNDGMLCVDPKARPTGRDIVTVNIDINDRANTQNTTARSRDNEISGVVTHFFGLENSLGQAFSGIS